MNAQRRQSFCIAALAVLVCVVVVAAPAHAAPGFSAPITLVRNPPPAGAVNSDNGVVVCFSLAGNAVAWTQVDKTELRPKERVFTSAHLESFDTTGPHGGQLIGPANAFASCPALDSSGSTVVGTANSEAPLALDEPPPISEVGALYVNRLGSPSAAVPDATGLGARAAAFPDGGSVVAWLALAPGAKASDPAFVVYAARRAADGTFSPPQLLGGPGTVDHAHGRDRVIVAPDVVADPDGSAEVAWTLVADAGRDSTVQVSQAPPGAPFGAPQTLAQPGPTGQGAVGLVHFAHGGTGRHVIFYQRISKSRDVGLQLTGQSAAGAPYAAIPELYAKAVEDGPATSGLDMDDIGDVFALVGPDSEFAGLPDDLAVLRKPAGDASFGAPQFLVPAGAGDALILDSALAVAPDGRAAVAWVQLVDAPFGGVGARVLLSTAPPGGRFGAPVAVSGLAPVADSVAATYDADGRLRIAWRAAPELLGHDDLFGVVQSPGAPDLLKGRGPAVEVSRKLGHGARSVSVAVRMRRSGTVRVHVSIPHAGGRLEVGSEAGHLFTRGGTAHVLVDLGAALPRGRRLSPLIVIYATDARGASTVARVTAHLKLPK